MEYNDSVVKTDVQHPQVYSPTFFCSLYVVWRSKDGDREETGFVNREGDKKNCVLKENANQDLPKHFRFS